MLVIGGQGPCIPRGLFGYQFCAMRHRKLLIAASYSAPGVLAEAAHKTGRAKADFELREISKEEYERFKSLLHL